VTRQSSGPLPAGVIVRQLTAPDSDWLALRRALWPQCPGVEHETEIAAAAAAPAKYMQFMACAGPKPLGLAEAAVRHEYVNGAQTSPVVFLEGIYVVPSARRRGIAAQLIAAVSACAAAAGYRELASDAQLENLASHALHAALGFEATERVVFFRKALRP
jgi:aminoglycoside 6'-N-acetyltransferase I